MRWGRTPVPDSSPAAGVHARLPLFHEIRKADVDIGQRTRVPYSI